MDKTHKDFYKNFRQEMRNWLDGKGKNNKWAEYLMFAPDLFHLLCKLAFDKDVPVREKAKLATAIAYFVAPVDMIPEAVIGPMGYIDDIALAAYVLNSILKNTDPEIVKRHWVGEENVLEVIKHILEVADNMLGSSLWKKLKKKVNNK
ncbi:MAG: YkvA family protein [Bacillota bacterium]